LGGKSKRVYEPVYEPERARGSGSTTTPRWLKLADVNQTLAIQVVTEPGYQPFLPAGAPKIGSQRSAGADLVTPRQIVEAHGSRVWVGRVPAQGATFRFSLPVGPPNQTPPPTEL